MKRIELCGLRFGRWLVLRYRESRSNQSFYWCRCECGIEKEVSGAYLRKGTSRSCGCGQIAYKRERRLERDRRLPNYRPLRILWGGMIGRCYRADHIAYPDYGARGIGVCDDWRYSSAGFIEWAHKTGYCPGLQLDRVDNDGPYSPLNCRFVERIVNANNKRNTRRYSLTIREICWLTGGVYSDVRQRIRSLEAKGLLPVN